MSKNHPHDNIYSILGKLEALTPKETPVQNSAPGFKEYAQVEARGSVLEGVAKVEATLAEKYMGFNKTVGALKKQGGIENPEALAASIGRKKYGKAKFQKAAAAGKKMGETLDGATVGGAGVVGEDTPDLSKHNVKYGVYVIGVNGGKPVKTFDNKDDAKAYADKGIRVGGVLKQGSVQTIVGEEATKNPDHVVSMRQKEQMVLAMQRQGYTPEQIARKMKRMGMPHSMEEDTCNECGMPMEGCGCTHTNEAIDPQRKKYGNVINKYFGKIYDYGDDGLDYLDRAAPTWFDLFDQYNGDIDTIVANAPINELQASAQELADVLSDLQSGIYEGETTHKDGVTKHEKTDYPGYPSSDLEDDDEDSGKPKKGRPRKAQTKNPRRDPNAPKKGRGRPSKPSDASKDSSTLPFSSTNKMGHDPFGRVKKDAHDKAKRVDEKAVSRAQQKFMGMVHAAQKGEKAASPEVAKVAKGMTKKAAHDFAATKHKGLPQHVKESITESVNLKRMIEEQHMTLEEMLECMNADMQQFKETGVCSDRLRDMMEVYSHAKRQMEEANAPVQQPTPATVPGQPVVGVPTKGIPGNVDLNRDKKINPPRTLEEIGLEEELNELARLAGLDEVSRGEYIKQKDAEAEHAGKGKFKAFGQEFDTDEISEEPNEGNLFTKGLEDDDVKIGDKIPGTNAIKKVDIDEAQELFAMLHVAGLDTKQIEEALSRRDFLKGAGVALGTAALAGVAGGAQAASNPTAELGQLPYMMMWVNCIAKYEKANPSGMFNPADIARAEKISIDALHNFYSRLYVANPDQRGPYNDMFREVNRDVQQSYQQIAKGDTGEAGTIKKYIANADKLADRLAQYTDQTYGNGIREALAKDEKTYGETDVDGVDEEELANSPDEEYLSMKASTLNPGEADPGEKQQNPDRPTFKNGDNAMSKPPVREDVFKLESKLAAEYESIKKSS